MSLHQRRKRLVLVALASDRLVFPLGSILMRGRAGEPPAVQAAALREKGSF
ncbi:MAG TPA: hypothetical protein VFU32_15410 [Ktedonobacterales bacterium]|nr:hypothetical protein [Ktedonobacterales bacterium]